MKDKENIELSIVVPAFNCADQLPATILSVKNALDSLEVLYEIIVVIDGRDDEAYREVDKIKQDNIKIFHFEENRGKGFTVQFGMQQASGNYIGYIDGDGDIFSDSLLDAYELIRKNDVDIVCGSKRHKDSKVKNYTQTRRLYTWGYNFFVRLLFGIKYKDTQVGLKLYSSELLIKILPALKVDGFAFEVEMLYLARKYGYRDHIDIPVKINYRFTSTATTLKSIVKMIQDTLGVFFRYKLFNLSGAVENKGMGFDEKFKQVRLL